MKNLLLSRLLRFLCLASLSSAALAHAADDHSTATVKLSAPGKPAILRVNMPWADIHILGVDGDTITVESTIGQKNAKSTREDGLRRLDDEVSFELTEHDNTVSLSLAGESRWASHDAEFKISVPRAMALDIKTEAGGDLAVKDIEGDLEISNMNGEVHLEGISGSTVVNTMNGEVRALFAKAPQKLVSITSMNGEVDLRVPADTKANVRLRTHNGSILTDFDEAVLKTKSEGKSSSESGAAAARASSEFARAAAEGARVAVQVAREVAREVERAVKEEMAEKTDAPAAEEAAAPRTPKPPRAPHAPRAPMPPITGGKIVSGTLNGGGVDIKVSTMNGEITLRQTK